MGGVGEERGGGGAGGRLSDRALGESARRRSTLGSTPRTLPIADSTTQGRWSGKEQMMSATSSMRSVVATDEPPNL